MSKLYERASVRHSRKSAVHKNCPILSFLHVKLVETTHCAAHFGEVPHRSAVAQGVGFWT